MDPISSNAFCSPYLLVVVCVFGRHELVVPWARGEIIIFTAESRMEIYLI